MGFLQGGFCPARRAVLAETPRQQAICRQDLPLLRSSMIRSAAMFARGRPGHLPRERANSRPAYSDTDAKTLLLCKSRQNSDDCVFPDAAGIQIRFSERAERDAIVRQPVEMLQRFECSFSGEAI
jgi:hypothetical protein